MNKLNIVCLIYIIVCLNKILYVLTKFELFYYIYSIKIAYDSIMIVKYLSIFK